MPQSVRITDEDYQKLKAISKAQDDKDYIKVLSRAINNLYKVVVVNRLKTKG